MLIISRKKGESIFIEGGIEIQLVDIQGDRAKLAIEAPKNIKIMRKELLEAAKANLDAVVPPGHVGLEELKKALKAPEGR